MHKASIVNRVIAKLIDLTLVIGVAAILPYPFGPLTGFLYSLLADGFHWGPFQNQSLGKKIMKLRVVHFPAAETRTGALFRDSVLRNSPVGVATFFAIIPVWGWWILALVGIPLMIMEVYLMVTVDTGHRLGDVMAETEVQEIERKS